MDEGLSGDRGHAPSLGSRRLLRGWKRVQVLAFSAVIATALLTGLAIRGGSTSSRVFMLSLLALVSLLAGRATSAAVTRTQAPLTQSLSELAGRVALDPLTGLLNHRAFHERLDEEVARARRDGRALALVLLDVDHFKRFNDLAGHQAGDDVLVALADALRAVARRGEPLGRVGGEEFAWIIPDGGTAVAQDAADRARRAVSEIPTPTGRVLTISAGVCDLQIADAAKDLLARADVALYWAKRNGRNTTVVSTAEMAREASIADRADLVEEPEFAALRILASAVEERDDTRVGHAERVARLCLQLASALGWSGGEAGLLRDAALVHDVGRIALPEEIARTPGPLAPMAIAEVRRHVAIGARIAGAALDGEQVAWIAHHGERWNGTGHPSGLRGDQIPGGAQLLGIASAWVAMTSPRPNRRALTGHEARRAILGEAGRAFDPALVRLLLSVIDRPAQTTLPADSSPDPAASSDDGDEARSSVTGEADLSTDTRPQPGR